VEDLDSGASWAGGEMGAYGGGGGSFAGGVLAGAFAVGGHAEWRLGDDDVDRPLFSILDRATSGVRCRVGVVRIGEHRLGARPRRLRGFGVRTAVPH